MKSLLFCLCCLIPSIASAVTIPYSKVGDAGNLPDAKGLGDVNYVFNIGTYDVTNAQYLEFLNAKDPTGANTLSIYSTSMTGIALNKAAAYGSKYSIANNRQNYPIIGTSWFSAARFTNWLNNGQGDADTETGAYTLSLPLADIHRNSDAKVFLPSNDEWHKAAFYNSSNHSYFLYATSSNTMPTASPPTNVANTANFFTTKLVAVGSYPNSASPYGVYDMAGNIMQWTDTIDTGFYRFGRGDMYLSSTIDSSVVVPRSGPADDINTNPLLGFRVASVPEPSTCCIFASGLMLLLIRRRI